MPSTFHVDSSKKKEKDNKKNPYKSKRKSHTDVKKKTGTNSEINKYALKKSHTFNSKSKNIFIPDKTIKIEDANYITSSLTLLNKTGGNIVKVFDTIEKNFFNKKRIKEEMHSLTTSSVFVFRMLCVLPFIFILSIYILNPTYFNPLFTTSIGRFLLGLVIVLYVLYIIVIKKVLEVKI